MNKSMAAMWIGIVLLFASWIIQPVKYVAVADVAWPVKESSFRFLNFDPPEAVRPLDWMRLILIDASIVTITVCAVVTLRRKWD